MDGIEEEEEMASGFYNSTDNPVDDTPNASANCHLFEIHKHNAKEIFPIIKSLMFREHCAISVCKEGFRIIVNDEHFEQASAYFKFDQFSEYIIRTSSIHLRVPMAILTEALNVFASNTTALRMHYDGEGEPLVLCVEDEGIVFNCSIRTQIPRPILDFEFEQINVVAKAILAPQSIKEIVRDFDQSSTIVIITITPQYISFFTDGDLGKIKIQIPSHSDQVELLECVGNQVSNAYRLSLIRRMHPSLALCHKLSLRVDNRGVLSIQFIVPLSENNTCFVEFYCVAHMED